MCGRWPLSGRAALCAFAYLLILLGDAMAGIPEPGFGMCGRVLDDSGALVTSGDLTIDFASVETGASLIITTPLSVIEGPGGPYSYRVTVPFETSLDGYPVSDGRLALPSAPLAYTRTMSVAGTPIAMSHAVTISEADRGTTQRVDVCAICPSVVRVTHSADLDADYSFSLSEFLRVYQLHNATATHEYHVDPSTADGYAPGPGSRDGLPHTADYDGGADWALSMSEVLRLVDIFTSTSDHSYSPYPLGDDGFQKGSGDLFLDSGQSSPPLSATLDMDGVLAADGGAGVPITVAVDAAGAIDLSALGVRVLVPNGWAYAGLDDSSPFIQPDFLDGGVIEFGWSGAVAVPFRFTFLVRPASVGVGDFSGMSSEVVYRVKSCRNELKSPLAYLTVAEGEGSEAGSDVMHVAAAPMAPGGASGESSTSPEPGASQAISVATAPTGVADSTVSVLGPTGAADSSVPVVDGVVQMPSVNTKSLALLILLVVGIGVARLHRRTTTARPDEKGI